MWPSSVSKAGAHYLDLADAREFVAGIGRLDDDARRRGLLVASGVSSTPAITSAMIAELAPDFAQIEEIHTALSPGKSEPARRRDHRRRPELPGAKDPGLSRRPMGRAAGLGRRAASPVSPSGRPPPRSQLRGARIGAFPAGFGARTVRFSAGLELNLLNYLLSLCALPCRWFGFDFTRRARFFLNVSLMLFPFGTTNGALAIWVRGRDHAGRPIERRIALVTDYDGPATPSSAAVVLARKILNSGPPRIGAFPCVGLLSLDELLAHLHPLGIWCARGDESGWSSRIGSSHETI